MKMDLDSFCNSPDHIWRPNRREFLFVGLVGSLGLTLGNMFKLQAQSVARFEALVHDAGMRLLRDECQHACDGDCEYGPDHGAPLSEGFRARSRKNIGRRRSSRHTGWVRSHSSLGTGSTTRSMAQAAPPLPPVS